MVEKKCLQMLALLLNTEAGAVNGLIRSGFIGRWLAKEPWGSPRDQNFLDAVSDFHSKMHPFLRALCLNSAAQIQLQQHKLLPSGDISELAQLSALCSKSEEQEPKRRRREAMVLHDGFAPIGEQDILNALGDEPFR